MIEREAFDEFIASLPHPPCALRLSGMREAWAARGRLCEAAEVEHTVSATETHTDTASDAAKFSDK